MKPIELTLSNDTKCLCPVCPVQKGSACVASRREEVWDDIRRSVVGGILEEYAEHPETYEMPIEELRRHPVGRKHGAERIARDVMIELYCSIGKSACGDLDSEKCCACPDCAVWHAHDLSSRYYCMSGSAASREGARR